MESNDSSGSTMTKKKKTRKGSGVQLRRQDAQRTARNAEFMLTFDELQEAYFAGKLSPEDYKAKKMALLSRKSTKSPQYEITICAKSNNVNIVRDDLLNDTETSSVLMSYGGNNDGDDVEDAVVHRIDAKPYVYKKGDISDGTVHFTRECPLSDEQRSTTIRELESLGYIDEDVPGEDPWHLHYGQRLDERATLVKHAIYHDLPRAHELALIRQLPLIEEKFHRSDFPIPRMVWDALWQLHVANGSPIVDLSRGMDLLRTLPRLTLIPQKHIEWPLLMSVADSPYDIRRRFGAWVLLDPGDMLINGNVCLHGNCEYDATPVDVCDERTLWVCVSIVKTYKEYNDAIKLKRGWYFICVRPFRMKLFCNQILLSGNCGGNMKR